MNLALGTTVRCADGAVRELADVVVDASGPRVTHVVVQPRHHPEGAHLVSLDLVTADGEAVSLRCTAEMLESLASVREHAYLPAGAQPETGADWSIGVEDVFVAPTMAPLGMAEPDLDPNVNLSYDRVPKGEVELRLTSSVYSGDKHRVGTVHGVEVRDDGQIAMLVLLRGHMWWQREIQVPADAIGSFENDLVNLAVPKRELRRFRSSKSRARPEAD
jgi:hypothetical protein